MSALVIRERNHVKESKGGMQRTLKSRIRRRRAAVDMMADEGYGEERRDVRRGDAGKDSSKNPTNPPSKSTWCVAL